MEFARSRSSGSRAAALAALDPQAAQPEQVIATELRDTSGAILLTTSPALRLDTIAIASLVQWSRERDSVVIGRFRFLRDTIAFPIAAPVAGANAVVVHWRRLVGSRRTREMMTRLIGSEASVFLGNPGLDRWTDLERAVPAPPVDTSRADARGLQSYSRAIAARDSQRGSADARGGRKDERFLAAISAIPGTPWFVAIDFPYGAMLAPVNDFLRRMTLIALMALVIGLTASYVMSRRISRPLRDLTDAAVAVASGRFSQAPEIKRSDELGRLGLAFATMASEVQVARDELERKVELRTRDLNATLHQLHEAQDALVRREKLALLGQLASGVGHELRNPLGVMTNAVYYLKTVLRSQPANVQEYLDIVQQQITLSEKIVGDLLDFARSKSPHRKPSHLADIVEAQLARLGTSPGVVIQTEFPRDLPHVRVDPVQAGQIILNLLTNAVQSINGGGGRIIIRASIAGDQVQCEVADNGSGIAREHLDKIFEPLFTTKARGIGLGLAVSRQLARANSGELTVSSTPGQGATFRLWLPIATGEIL
jgi:signal transduction histidine kinase